MAPLSARQKEAPTINQAHMEKICEICGDVGFQEAIITCYKCKTVDVHQYCVVGYYEDAPLDWCCEECDIAQGLTSSSRGVENEHSEGFKLPCTAKICQITVQPKKHNKFLGRHGVNWEKEVRTGKTRYLPVEEALRLPSGIMKHRSLLINTVSSRVMSTKSTTIIPRGNFSKLGAQISNLFPEKSTVQRFLGSEGHTKLQNLQTVKITEHGKKQVQLFEGPGSSAILEHRCPNAGNENQMIDLSTTHPYDPAIVPSWEGCFDIFGDAQIEPGIFNNCVQAHAPSRVRHKMYEFSGLLPDILRVELVPRGDIWTSLFKNHSPGKEDVGVYFFKASERGRSETFITLVEFMHVKDLVMRTLINDVELLILPSTTLSSDSQRWNGEHFLWGLFYRMGQDTDGCAEGGSNEVIDMEIDMIGGEDVFSANKVDIEGYQDKVGMEIVMIGGEDVRKANKADMVGYQSEVEMEIDMIGGQNVGTQDIVVSRTTRNGFGGSSLKEPATSATCIQSESVTPLVSRTSQGCKKLIQVIKCEPVDDFPAGFTPHPHLTSTK